MIGEPADSFATSLKMLLSHISNTPYTTQYGRSLLILLLLLLVNQKGKKLEKLQNL
jgi:hypothetical protein